MKNNEKHEEYHYEAEWTYIFETAKDTEEIVYRPPQNDLREAIESVFAEAYDIYTTSARQILTDFDLWQNALDIFYYDLKPYFEKDAEEALDEQKWEGRGLCY